jgi:hypothetical protein
MKMLIAVIAAQWLHVGHPKMVGERADPAHRLFEGVLDLEAQTIETNDLDSLQGRVGAHQEAGASCGMDHGDEAHQASDQLGGHQLAYGRKSRCLMGGNI